MGDQETVLFIDTDPGVDDALAIMMAHVFGRVVGLGIAAGNVGLAHTTANALKLLDVIGSEAPVFRGAPQTLVRPAHGAAHVHGADGFGDTGYLPTSRGSDAEHASLALLRLSHAHPCALTIVVLGPLTNLALALSLDPALPTRVRRLVVMGGAVTGQGNTSATAEFNVGFDPEAAHVVFSRWGEFQLVDWELCMRHALPAGRLESWLAHGGARPAFFAAISRKIRAFSHDQGRAGLVLADALAMAVALQPELVLASRRRSIRVELDGFLTRGATVVDWNGRGGQPPNALIAEAIDQQGFERMVAESLGLANG